MNAPTATTVPPRIAIIVPCYCSVQSLAQLTQRLRTALDASSYAYEIVFVDDASPGQQTWDILKKLKTQHPDVVRCFRLSRNTGQHNAIQCGFAQISPSAEIVVTMDDDLQHRPEDIPALLRAIEDGADIAIGAYDIKHQSRLNNLGGKLVDSSLRRLFALPPDVQLTSFRAIRRFAVDDVLENQSRYMYLTAALLSATRFHVNVPVIHESRLEGRSGYSLARSVELAANLFLSYSRWPLYLIAALFGISLLATLTITGWVMWKWWVTSQLSAGWTSTMMMLGITSTFNLAALAVVALLSTRSHRQLVGSAGRWRISERI
ncbi:MAG: glycosyltransferase family 2 protein [Thermomonas sp.]|uniref:glycosyltransferase family 2 protein n=1 Tax=Thermomonas sp. TaxID=1971895 RepID=UPI00260BF465|nr:glycosyltransferase family 2 protein [Thermomonas sp.]MCC7097779.1 glycosyltransferase family 2 protein [Thermomonas sp.]